MQGVFWPASVLGAIAENPFQFATWSRQIDLREKEWIDYLLYFLDSIDQKANSLLVHVSLMTAVSAVFLAMPDHRQDLTKILLAMEVTAYLYVSACCIRSTGRFERIAKISKKGAAVCYQFNNEFVRREVTFRMKVYNFAYFSALVLTILLAVTILFHMNTVT